MAAPRPLHSPEGLSELIAWPSKEADTAVIHQGESASPEMATITAMASKTARCVQVTISLKDLSLAFTVDKQSATAPHKSNSIQAREQLATHHTISR